MKKTMLCLLAAGLAVSASAKEPVDYVNTSIGTISHLLVPCFRTVQLPNAMFRFIPPEHDFTQDRVGPLALQRPGHRAGGVAGCYPYSGPKDGLFAPWTSTWDQEHAKPHAYDVIFDTWDIRFDLVPAVRGALATFTFRRPDEVHAVVLREDEITVSKDGQTVAMKGSFAGIPVHFAGAFDVRPVSVERQDKKTAFVFAPKVKSVKFRYAISYIDATQAKANLAADVPDWNAEALAKAGCKAWNAKLGKIEVEGGTEDERSVFYSALWRTYERMVNITEDGRYRGWDRRVHATEGVDQYVDDWIWDSYRAHHPLMVILEPTAESAKLTSYLRLASQNREGWVPTFPELSHDSNRMVNHHVAISFLDAWTKGVRGFDLKAAYTALDHTERTESLVPWHCGPWTELDRFMDEHGYFPALAHGEQETCKAVGGERRQAVSVTQGASYDVWALARMARVVGDKEGEAYYRKRSQNYRNLWDPETRFFRPKDSTGAFVTPFDPIRCGGYGARNYYTENNAWTYIWDVQHDLGGLRELLGGAEGMERRLDEMFNTGVGCRWDHVQALPDGSTGLMGNFSMANEPSFHIPYLYNLAGQPRKTQKLVRKTLEAWFRNDRMGMCGDEDGGGMCAYAVFSMMGFYPVTPGLPHYEIGSPVFSKVTIHLENGKDFTVSAPGASYEAKYWTKGSIGGRPLQGTRFRHKDILAGQTLLLKMTDHPVVAAGPEITVGPAGPEITVGPAGDPELDAWAAKTLLPTLKTWYPKIAEMYASPEFRPLKRIRLRFRTDMGGIPAWAAGDEICLNKAWIKSQLKGESLGSTVHELTHVVQQYPGGAPGWFQEGFADYVRWYQFEPEKHGCVIRNWDDPKVKYDASYRVSANFLDWVARTHGRDVLKKVNAACRARRYRDELWKELTGATLDELGGAWKEQGKKGEIK